jgi:TonB family protein
MGHLKKFVTISLVFHAIVVLSLVDVELSGKKVDTSDVYNVSIVAGAPAASSPSAGIAQGRKFSYNKAERKATLGEVKKERGLKEAAPEISSKNIKPEEPVEPGPDIASSAGAGNKGQAAKGQGQGGGSPSEIALWKVRVRGLVEMLWKPPPEIDIMDMSLQTTYLLRVSRDGELIQKKLLVSSGNAPFDRSILTALNKASHFPPPPPSLIAGQDWVEVTMSFKPPKGA